MDKNLIFRDRWISRMAPVPIDHQEEQLAPLTSIVTSSVSSSMERPSWSLKNESADKIRIRFEREMSSEWQKHCCLVALVMLVGWLWLCRCVSWFRREVRCGRGPSRCLGSRFWSPGKTNAARIPERCSKSRTFFVWAIPKGLNSSLYPIWKLLGQNIYENFNISKKPL